MDLQIPDLDANESSDQPSAIFVERLLDALVSTLPPDEEPGSSPEQVQQVRAERRDVARVLFDSMHPRDAVEAALAARAVAAHYASMDMFARAARPGTTDEKAIRLRSSAIAASRSFDTALRALEKRQSKPVQVSHNATAAEVSTPAAKRASPSIRAAGQIPGTSPEAPPPKPRSQRYQPRDAFGAPIPRWDHERMTMAQRRAAYGDPNDTAVQAEAIAEEEAMIAEQRARDAAAQAPTLTQDQPATAG